MPGLQEYCGQPETEYAGGVQARLVAELVEPSSGFETVSMQFERL